MSWQNPPTAPKWEAPRSSTSDKDCPKRGQFAVWPGANGATPAPAKARNGARPGVKYTTCVQVPTGSEDWTPTCTGAGCVKKRLVYFPAILCHGMHPFTLFSCPTAPLPHFRPFPWFPIITLSPSPSGSLPGFPSWQTSQTNFPSVSSLLVSRDAALDSLNAVPETAARTTG